MEWSPRGNYSSVGHVFATGNRLYWGGGIQNGGATARVASVAGDTCWTGPMGSFFAFQSNSDANRWLLIDMVCPTYTSNSVKFWKGIRNWIFFLIF
jgi:hypothetical protein